VYKIYLIGNVSCAQDMTHWKHIMCTNVHFKSESFNTHSKVSDLSYEKVEEFIYKKVSHCWMNIGSSRFKMCIGYIPIMHS
jgi:hypothetical protein